MASLTQIAKKAGVSITAASLVLNKKDHGTRVSAECAERIRAIARDVGYVANYHASSIKRGRSESVAVAMDIGEVRQDHTISARVELATPYFGLVISGIDAVMRRRGFFVTIVGPDASLRAPDRAMVGVRQRRFDGMIVLGPTLHLHETRILTAAPEHPLVVLEPPMPTPAPSVDYDEKLGVGLAIEHLVKLGHKSLIWVGPTVADTVGKRPVRQQIFQEQCREAGLRFELLESRVRFPAYDDVPESAREVMARRLAQQERTFTAVVTYNDNTALGVLDALLEAGLSVPGDVSVVGHDDFEGRRCRPRLTSVDHRLGEMGIRAAELLMRMIEEPRLVTEFEGRCDLVKPRLNVRGSTAAPVL